MPNNTTPGFIYPDAGGEDAQPEVQDAVERFRDLPLKERAKLPLLYWLLGSGTPELKFAKADVAYGLPQARNQTCENCVFAYAHLATGDLICSQVSGTIDPQKWCNRWSQ